MIKLSLNQKRKLRKVTFKDYQIDSVIANVKYRYNRKIGNKLALFLLRRLYFLDQDQSIKFLDDYFIRKIR